MEGKFPRRTQFWQEGSPAEPGIVPACLLAAPWAIRPRRLKQAEEQDPARGQRADKVPAPYDTLPKGETDTNQTEN